jgi:hypothetical protein
MTATDQATPAREGGLDTMRCLIRDCDQADAAPCADAAEYAQQLKRDEVGHRNGTSVSTRFERGPRVSSWTVFVPPDGDPAARGGGTSSPTKKLVGTNPPCGSERPLVHTPPAVGRRAADRRAWSRRHWPVQTDR